MKRNYFAIFCIAAATLVGCTEAGGEDDAPKSVGVVTIDPIIATRATEANFEEGDKIGLTVISSDSQLAMNEEVAFDGTLFTSDVEWGADATIKADVYAYYPYAEALTEFSVAEDQSADGAYTASDLMGAIKEGVSPSATTSMTFTHLLSHLVVNVTNEGDKTIESIVVDGTIPTATFDPKTMGVAVKADADAVCITALDCGNGVYKAIIVPQTVNTNLTFNLSGGSATSISIGSTEFIAGGECPVEVVIGSDGDISFIESQNQFVYHGDSYELVTLENGSKWMAQPMRYIPEGITPSSDPTVASGMWYPYKAENSKAEVLTDSESIMKKGYLYDQETAFKETITPENFNSFEGIQGICPKGWHIPTRADYIALVGYSNKSTIAEESAPITDEDALFYDADINGGSIAAMNEAGWNYVFTGVRMQSTFTANPSYISIVLTDKNCGVADFIGELSMSYYMASTANTTSYSSADPTVLTNIQYFALMPSFTTSYMSGRLTVAYSGMKNGQSLRCVKDSE